MTQTPTNTAVVVSMGLIVLSTSALVCQVLEFISPKGATKRKRQGRTPSKQQQQQQQHHHHHQQQQQQQHQQHQQPRQVSSGNRPPARPPPATTRAGGVSKNTSSDEKASSSLFSSAYESLIGNTPLVKLSVLSRLLKRHVYVKMELANPGGTGKDRAALFMLRAAERSGELPPPGTCEWSEHRERFRRLVGNTKNATEVNPGEQGENHPTASSPTQHPKGDEKNHKRSWDESIVHTMAQSAVWHSQTGGVVVEGTSGSTGIALASLCAAGGRGHAVLIVMPDDQASEKRQLLETLGAFVVVVPTAAISNPQHYVQVAQRAARLINDWGRKVAGKTGHNDTSCCFWPRACFMNQFENLANTAAHYHTTGPELWRQRPSGQDWDAFVMSAGTGGTLAGCALYFSQRQSTQQRKTRMVLVDPPGSALYHKIASGVLYAEEQAEQSLRRNRYDSLAEGIGLDRTTANFALAVPHVEEAIRVSDQDALDMAHWLLQHEGFFVGSSSAMNVVGALGTALKLPEGAHVVTILCDGGSRHVTRFWNRTFCEQERLLTWPRPDTLQAFLQRQWQAAETQEETRKC